LFLPGPSAEARSAKAEARFEGYVVITLITFRLIFRGMLPRERLVPARAPSIAFR
jgi:hypothetical protein